MTYAPGLHGKFPAQVTENLILGKSTPKAPIPVAEDGYIFTGWSPAVAATVTGNVTYVALWKEETTYSVTYLPGSYGTFATKITEGLKAGSATPAAPTVTGQTGYRFVGWSPAVAATVTDNATYTATWQLIPVSAIYYTVRFVDFDGSLIKTEQVVASGNATAPKDPARDGYTFSGWDKDFSNIKSDLTVTAMYEKNKDEMFTVNFVDYDGRLLKTEKIILGGNALAPTEPTRDGYTFIGWDKEFTNIIDNITVTARYEQNIVYVTSGNSNEPSRDEVIEQLLREGVPSITLGGLVIPLTAGSMGKYVWALVNLVIAIVGIILGLLAIVRYMRGRKVDEDSYNFRVYNEKDNRKTKNVLFTVVSIILSLLGLLLFVITENMNQAMVLIDRWTMLNAVIFVLGLVSYVLIHRKEHNEYRDALLEVQ